MARESDFLPGRNAWVALVLLTLAVGGFSWRAASAGARAAETAVAAAVFGLALLVTLAFTDFRFVQALRNLGRRGGARVWFFPLAVWAVALVYGAVFARSALPLSVLFYGLLPVALAKLANRLGERPNVGDLLAILAIWFPVELDWISGPPLPPAKGVIGLGSMLAMPFALYTFLSVRAVSGVGFRLDFRREDLKWAVLYFLAFVPFALALGLPTGFIRPSTQAPSAARVVLTVVAIFLFTGVPEEVLFRGLIQNLLAQRLGEQSRWKPVSLVVTSVIFGWAHVNNRVPPLLHWSLGPLGSLSVPWVYIVLATIAGVFYGLAYLRTGKVTTAAIVHALVDATWGLGFSG
ncbi:MAG: CPBP family intramembrane metalloprotease [candidate division KSB1 bacterium]|nr:CPBP family intramembrane metalloprotease [candidate division KSB1 bacterium]